MDQTLTTQSRALAFFANHKPLVLAYIIMVSLLIIAEIMVPGYLNINHASNLMRQISFLAIVCIGQTYVIISGGIDLSIAAVINLSNIVAAAQMAGKNENVLVACLAVFGIGLLSGASNGLGVHFLRIPPLVMTLAISSVVQGFAFIYSRGAPKGATAPFIQQLATGRLLNIISIPFIIFVMLATVFIVILHFTTMGRSIYAVGANSVTAEYSGVNVARVRLGVYMVSGFMCSLVGLLLIGYTGTSFLNTGDPFTMNSITAVVIGGVSVAGGVGSYVGTIAGAVIMTVVLNLLTVARIPEFGRQLAQGLILLAILLLYGREKKKR